ncbi:MAG: hypothetical protein ACLP9L_12155 [Thermoguttaceae bacterium]
MPGVTFVDVCMTPARVLTITKTIDEFLRALIALRLVDDKSIS